MNKYQEALDYLIENIKMLNKHCEDGSFCEPNWSKATLQELIDKTNYQDKSYEMIRTLELIHEHINAIENVYYRNHSMEGLYASYILEKLTTAKNLIDLEIKYWEKYDL